MPRQHRIQSNCFASSGWWYQRRPLYFLATWWLGIADIFILRWEELSMKLYEPDTNRDVLVEVSKKILQYSAYQWHVRLDQAVDVIDRVDDLPAWVCCHSSIPGLSPFPLYCLFVNMLYPSLARIAREHVSNQCSRAVVRSFIAGRRHLSTTVNTASQDEARTIPRRSYLYGSSTARPH